MSVQGINSEWTRRSVFLTLMTSDLHTCNLSDVTLHSHHWTLQRERMTHTTDFLHTLNASPYPRGNLLPSHMP